MARFTIFMLLALNLAIAAAAAPQQQLARRMLLDLPAVPTVDGTNVQRTNQIISYGDALDTVVQNEAQAQAQAGITTSVTSAVADTIKAGQVDSDTRRHIAGGDASASISNAAGAGGNAATATREAAGLAGYTVYGKGLALNSGDRSNLANLESQRAVQLGLDSGRGNAFLSTERASESAEAATRATASHEWTN